MIFYFRTSAGTALEQLNLSHPCWIPHHATHFSERVRSCNVSIHANTSQPAIASRLSPCDTAQYLLHVFVEIDGMGTDKGLSILYSIVSSLSRECRSTAPESCNWRLDNLMDVLRRNQRNWLFVLVRSVVTESSWCSETIVGVVGCEGVKLRQRAVKLTVFLHPVAPSAMWLRAWDYREDYTTRAVSLWDRLAALVSWKVSTTASL